jgi:hypothetical protein
MKLWRLLKIEGSVLIYIVHPLGPTYIGERRTTFAKAHGLEVRCICGEHVEEHIGSQKDETMEAPQNRRFCFDIYSSSPWAHLYR